MNSNGSLYSNESRKRHNPYGDIDEILDEDDNNYNHDNDDNDLLHDNINYLQHGSKRSKLIQTFEGLSLRNSNSRNLTASPTRQLNSYFTSPSSSSSLSSLSSGFQLDTGKGTDLSLQMNPAYLESQNQTLLPIPAAVVYGFMPRYHFYERPSNELIPYVPNYKVQVVWTCFLAWWYRCNGGPGSDGFELDRDQDDMVLDDDDLYVDQNGDDDMEMDLDYP